MMERRRRLPGVSFQVEASAPEETLPRMDIAAFVGLASAGPLDAPVLIEDPVRFRDIFGPDLPLVRDQAGALEHARLGPTVEAFFRNGGRRCYVVRVTGRADDGATLASTSRFILPGLVEVRGWNPSLSIAENASLWTPTLSRARSEGTWSERLRTTCALTSRVLTLPGSSGGALTFTDGRYRLELSACDLSLGDQLRLTWLLDGLELLLIVRELQTLPGRVVVTSDKTSAWWFSLQPPEGLELLTTAPTELIWQTVDGPVTLTAAADPTPPLALDTTGSLPRYSLWVESPANRPAPGELVRVHFSDGSVLLMPLDAVETSSLTENTLTLSTSQARWPLAPPTPPATAPYVEKLTLRIQVWQERAVVGELTGLTLHPAHERCWARLPTDRALWQVPPGGVPRETGPLDALASSPRFPLAGPGTVALMQAQAQALDEALAYSLPTWLPLGVPTLDAAAAATVLADTARGPLDPAPPLTRLNREGLEQFNADMFLDPALATLGTAALETEAFHRFYVQRQPLLGLHALLPIEEVSLLGLPDASLRHWKEVTPPVLTLLSAPTLAPVQLLAVSSDTPDTLVLSWNAVAGARRYQLELSLDASFSAPQRIYDDSLTSFQLPIPDHCPTVLFFRVRATDGRQLSPYSNTERVKAPPPSFETCGETWLLAADWKPVEGTPGAGDFTLSWSAVAGADRYCLEISTDPAFRGLLRAFLTSELSHTLPPLTTGVYYYRVQPWRTDGSTLPEAITCLTCGDEANTSSPAERGPWSTTLVLNVPPASQVQLEPPSDYDDSDLRAVQLSALRFAASRADLVVVLSLPLSYRSPEALAHVSRLSPNPTGSPTPLGTGVVQVPLLSDGESRALSYGALYHPWLAVSSSVSANLASPQAQTSAPVFIPPEGPLMGVMAALTLKTGAWIAPANVRLEGGLALFPPFSSTEWQAAYAIGLNVLRQDVRGFSAQSSETLSLEPELAPLNVRRLMILLRRLCLREGHRLVFAPNTPQLRSRVRRAFEGVLTELFVRGAFAGSVPDRAFQVVADDTLNPPQSVDAGRLVLELRVAPSKPLSFMTVRLVQQGAAALAIRED